MIHGKPALVRRLRRQARRAWKKLPRARRGRPPQRTWPFTPSSSLVLRWTVSLAIFLFLIAAPEFPPALWFGFMALHTLLATLRQTAGLAAGLHDPQGLMVPCILPLDDRTIFDAQTWQFRQSLRALALDWLLLGLGLAFSRGHPGWWIAAPLLALAQAGFSGACALFLARLRPDRRWAQINFVLTGLVGGLFLFGRALPVVQQGWSQGLEFLGRFSPAGLFATGAHHAAIQTPSLFAALGLVAAGTVGLTRHLARAWRAAYSTDSLHEMPPDPEPERQASGDEIPPGGEEASTPDGMPSPGQAPIRSSVFDNPHDRELLRRELHARLHYDPGDAYAGQGPMERLFACLWSARQRRLLTLYGPPAARWHRRFAAAVLITVLASLAAASGGGLPVALIGAGIAFALVLPVLERRWGALWLVHNGQTPMHGYLPVSLPSLAGACLSLAYAKIVFAGILLVLALAPWIGAAHALYFGALGSCLGLVWAPFSFLLTVSSGTNDSSARWWLQLLAIGSVVGTVAGGITLISVAIAAGDSRAVSICAGLAVTGSHALLAGYLWAAGRRWFDLMPAPKG